MLGRPAKASTLLAGVPAHALAQLFGECDRQKVPAGAVVIAPGTAADSLYIVVSGSLSVHLSDLDEPAVYVIEQGETAGELALLDDSARSAWVVAGEASEIAVLGRDAFWRLVDEYPCVAVNLLRALAHRVKRGNLKLSESRQLMQLYARHAATDALTGLHNRRWLDDKLERQVRRAKLSAEPLSVLMIDADHFKAINDNFGHAGGDFVLFALGKLLASALRPTDLLARYGGEEFTVVLPRTALPGALVAAERLRRVIAESELVLPDGTPLPAVTVSVGVAELRAEEDAKALLQRGDAALYSAKHGGRNCVAS